MPDREEVPMGLAFVGRASWPAADLPVSLLRPTSKDESRTAAERIRRGCPLFFATLQSHVFQRRGFTRTYETPY